MHRIAETSNPSGMTRQTAFGRECLIAGRGGGVFTAPGRLVERPRLLPGHLVSDPLAS